MFKKVRSKVGKKAAKPEAAISPSGLKLKKSAVRKDAEPVIDPKTGMRRLPSAWQIAKKAAAVFRKHPVLFLGITFVYGVLSIVLASGLFVKPDIESIKELQSGALGLFGGSLAAFATLAGSSNASGGQGGTVFRLFLIIVASLAYIWAMRQVMAGSGRLRIRDAFYQGMYPLIPVLLVALVVLLQLLPVLIGGSLYSLAMGGNIVVNAVEQAIFALIFLGLLLLSVFLIISSVFAVYIAALPDMTPMKALRSARDLVRGRRLSLFRKLLFLVAVLGLLTVIIVLPVIMTVTSAAPFVLYVVTLLVLPAVHLYLYTLYRELLA
ncbi:MAG TPA: hypothetical protein VF572_02600 [Candidatus Saccharimonadales bacterium]|jgi:hypothetical protein